MTGSDADGGMVSRIPHLVQRQGQLSQNRRSEGDVRDGDGDGVTATKAANVAFRRYGPKTEPMSQSSMAAKMSQSGISFWLASQRGQPESVHSPALNLDIKRQKSHSSVSSLNGHVPGQAISLGLRRSKSQSSKGLVKDMEGLGMGERAERSLLRRERSLKRTLRGQEPGMGVGIGEREEIGNENLRLERKSNCQLRGKMEQYQRQSYEVDIQHRLDKQRQPQQQHGIISNITASNESSNRKIVNQYGYVMNRNSKENDSPSVALARPEVYTPLPPYSSSPLAGSVNGNASSPFSRVVKPRKSTFQVQENGGFPSISVHQNDPGGHLAQTLDTTPEEMGFSSINRRQRSSALVSRTSYLRHRASFMMSPLGVRALKLRPQTPLSRLELAGESNGLENAVSSHVGTRQVSAGSGTSKLSGWSRRSGGSESLRDKLKRWYVRKASGASIPGKSQRTGQSGDSRAAVDDEAVIPRQQVEAKRNYFRANTMIEKNRGEVESLSHRVCPWVNRHSLSQVIDDSRPATPMGGFQAGQSIDPISPDLAKPVTEDSETGTMKSKSRVTSWADSSVAGTTIGAAMSPQSGDGSRLGMIKEDERMGPQFETHILAKMLLGEEAADLEEPPSSQRETLAADSVTTERVVNVPMPSASYTKRYSTGIGSNFLKRWILRRSGTASRENVVEGETHGQIKTSVIPLAVTGNNDGEVGLRNAATTTEDIPGDAQYNNQAVRRSQSPLASIANVDSGYGRSSVLVERRRLQKATVRTVTPDIGSAISHGRYDGRAQNTAIIEKSVVEARSSDANVSANISKELTI
jgi:hypothetical protein